MEEENMQTGKVLSESSLLLLEGLNIITKQLLTITIQNKQLKLATNALKLLRDDPQMTGWQAHNIAEEVLTEIQKIDNR